MKKIYIFLLFHIIVIPIIAQPTGRYGGGAGGGFSFSESLNNILPATINPSQPTGKYGGGSGDGFAFAESLGGVLYSPLKPAISQKIAIYPNPIYKHTPFLYIESPFKGDVTAKWYAINGALLYIQEVTKNNPVAVIKRPALSSGVYMLIIEETTKNVFFQKVIVQ